MRKTYKKKNQEKGKERMIKVYISGKAETWHILLIHSSMRDEKLPPVWQSVTGRENEVPNHFELPLLQYFPNCTRLTPSSSTG